MAFVEKKLQLSKNSNFDIIHFWVVPEGGIFMKQLFCDNQAARRSGQAGRNTATPQQRANPSQEKCPGVPQRTPQPGPGTGMPRCGSRGKRRRQTSSPILYGMGEVVAAVASSSGKAKGQAE